MIRHHIILATILLLLYFSHPVSFADNCTRFTKPAPVTTRKYSVASLSIPIVYNRFGDVDPNGRMFALEENRDALTAYANEFIKNNNSNSYNNNNNNNNNNKKVNPLVKPLVLRCNMGDDLEVTLTNHIRGRNVGIHLSAFLQSVRYDGTKVVKNPSSLAAFGESVTYKWKCITEGAYHFMDGGSYSGTENGTNLHGLFGALIVEPKGSYWTDPITGKDTVDALSADIHPVKSDCSKKKPFEGFETELPQKSESFREHVTIFHDEPPIILTQPMPANPCGEKVKNPALEETHAINYRAAPIRNVERLVFQKINSGDEGIKKRPTYGEEQHHSSWFNGDPDTPILHNYAGDPVKFRVIHGGIKETHMFHFHVHEWYLVDMDTTSPIIDSFGISPQASLTFTVLYGAGSRLKAMGDVIFHCHLYPHFAAGMWGLFRVFNTLQDGSQKYPDKTPIASLVPLPDREAPPAPTTDKPGFPNFIEGVPGQKSPMVPWPVSILGPIPKGSDYREATPKEIKAMNADPQPGNFFTLIPMPRSPLQVERNIIATVKNVEFNQYGWHHSQGHLYQMEDEQHGDPSKPTAYVPLVHRINKNSVVTNKMTSKMPPSLDGTVFDPAFPECQKRPCEMEVGLHVHLVKFDVLACDGSAVGWNYMTGTRIDKFLYYRWWVDEEFGQIFFHDHLFPVYRQKRGMYGVLTVQAEGAVWLNPQDHRKQTLTGLSAVILNNNINVKCATCNFKFDMQSYREIVQYVADFTPAFDKQGTPLNPPQFPGSGRDNGVMVVNYRSEPIHERIQKYRREHNNSEPDPADLFSSRVFGDPSTPLFEAYPGDQIIIRLIDGANEESHSLTTFGLRWRDTMMKRRTFSNQQHLGISEQYNLYMDTKYGPGDKALMFRAVDDTWIGCWSILRVYASFNVSLVPLPNNLSPDCGGPLQSVIEELNSTRHRQYKVVAKNMVINYTKGFQNLQHVDPFGIVYQVTAMRENDKSWQEFNETFSGEPMVIRALQGELVTVHLTNSLDPKGKFQAEPARPRVPVELDNFTRISSRVSIHADLVLTDTNLYEGSNFGFNVDSTVDLGKTKTYTWYMDAPLGTVLLQDQADFRNHRHHGLVGALIVEDPNFIPTSWTGTETLLNITTEYMIHESVIIFQDGMRHFVNGDLKSPVPDRVDTMDDGDRTDPTDQGQKGFNYGSAFILEPTVLGPDNPPTRVFTTRNYTIEKMCLVGTHDKPRGLTFVLHGHAFDNHTIVDKNAINPGYAGEATFISGNVGDWVFRAGNLRHHVSEGMWGILRVEKGGA